MQLIHPSNLVKLKEVLFKGKAGSPWKKSNGKLMEKLQHFHHQHIQIPAASDIPKEFNVEIFKEGSTKENVVNKSETTW